MTTNLEAWAGVAAEAVAGDQAEVPAGVGPISAKLILFRGNGEGLLKKMNIEHLILQKRTMSIECRMRKMEKFIQRVLLNDILQETEGR